MTPGARLSFVVWGVAIACRIAGCFVTVVFVDDMLSKLTNNTGSLAWPIGVVLAVFYFALARMGVALTRSINSALVNGRFRLQALAAPFRVYADGAITPLSEEIPALRELNAIDLVDKQARMALLDDPEYQKRFRAMWFHDKKGLSLARIKRCSGSWTTASAAI